MGFGTADPPSTPPYNYSLVISVPDSLHAVNVQYLISATINALEGMGQPIPATMHRGHIPGARNILCKDLFDEKTNCFHKPERIKEGKESYIMTWLEENIVLHQPVGRSVGRSVGQAGRQAVLPISQSINQSIN